jgi:hypothetical protein
LTVAATAGVRNEQQGLAASLWQTSFQVGGAVVLAVVTAVVDAGGAGTLTSPAATLTAYRPALYLITGVAAIGLLAALPGLRRGRADADTGAGAEAGRRADTPVAVPAPVRAASSGSVTPDCD